MHFKKNDLRQYTAVCSERQLNKAYCGFIRQLRLDDCPIANDN